MKTISKIFIFITATFLLSSCAKVFYSPDSRQLAQQEKIIAIIPPHVSYTNVKKIDPEVLKQQERTESLTFQREIYSWMLKRKSQGKITQEIMDPETTNAKLKKAGYPEEPLTASELCSALGVDGIMTSNFSLNKPISEGAAVAIGVLVGVWVPTNEVKVTLSIHDCAQNKLIFNYDHEYSGSVGSSANRLVNALMRNASKKMPYIKK